MIETISHNNRTRGHCASLCNHMYGLLASYYIGAECSDHQRIVVEFWYGKKKVTRRFPYKTGNSILIPTSQDEATIIMSYFEDEDDAGNKPVNAVQRWMFCSNWQSKLRYSGTGKIWCSAKERLELPIGYLVRCTPIRVNETWLLPVYREHNCHGLILTSQDGWNWTQSGTIGAEEQQESGRFGTGVLIQPTLWTDGTKLYSLSRDVTEKQRAWYAESANLGKTWTKPKQVALWNANNSVVAVQDGTNSPWLIWNHGAHRHRLVIGKWDPQTHSALPSLMINDYHGSYPNYCWHGDKLHVIYTEYGRIVRRIFNKTDLGRLSEGGRAAWEDIPTIGEWNQQ